MAWDKICPRLRNAAHAEAVLDTCIGDGRVGPYGEQPLLPTLGGYRQGRAGYRAVRRRCILLLQHYV